MANIRGKEEVVTNLLFLGSRIIADSDCTHEIRIWLLVERKAMTNLDSVLKNRGIILPTKVHIVKAMVFPVFTYGCESWTVKKAECQRIDTFELRCWRRLLKVPWTARSNQSILREINPEYTLEGLMLKLKLQYFGRLLCTDDSLKMSLVLEKIQGRKRRGHQGMRQLDSIAGAMNWTWANSGRWWETGWHRVLQSVGSQRVESVWVTEQL